ncbi:unnamed protein product, partial [Thlaspi arvense]
MPKALAFYVSFPYLPPPYATDACIVTRSFTTSALISRQRLNIPCIQHILSDALVTNEHVMFKDVLPKCNIDLHLRCADSLLRGLIHRSHKHKSLVKKSFHTHPLVCKIFLGNDGSFEYCGVCETMVHAGHHAYSCEECDFLGHIGCTLREEEPSPLYLKILYLCGKDVTRATNQKTVKRTYWKPNLWCPAVPNFFHIAVHIHVMRPIHMGELGEKEDCNICKDQILGNPYTSFVCRARVTIKKSASSLGTPFNTPAFATYTGVNALEKSHRIMERKLLHQSQARDSSGYRIEVLYGKALSCMSCEEIYHSRCLELWRGPVFDHPLHPNHLLAMRVTSGANCIACKMNIPKHGYSCYVCNMSFHIECIKAVIISTKIKSHVHYIYNFWMQDLRLTQACSVCAKPCGVSFYGCVDCNFNAHVECVGVATIVRSQQHQHSVVQKHIYDKKICSLCGSECSGYIYRCKHCHDWFHIKCLMPMDDRKAATEEEQLCHIYLTYLERDLLDLLK